MTTNQYPRVNVRIIAERGGRDLYLTLPTSAIGADDLHTLRHSIAESADVDPMRVDLYNVEFADGEYIGHGFDAYDGCDSCRWDQNRY
jgi:hypothetical protein